MSYTIFVLDGGAGRVISAIPALEKYQRLNPDDDFKIMIHGWDTLLWSHPTLQDRSFNIEDKGIFETYFLNAKRIVSPEPYRVPGYFKTEMSLAEAFDELINNTTDHSDLIPPRLFLNKAEEKQAANMIADIKSQQQKSKTIVIQPFGRGVRKDRNDIIDEASRSLTPDVYLKLVKKLASKFNLIFFGEPDYQLPDDPSMKLQGDLRMYMAIIEASDYFIGCDSVGQHMARAFNKPGTVIMGSTFAVNTTYPDWFNIWENELVEKVYSPIRISQLGGHLADRLNDRCMDLTDQQVEDLYKNIIKDIERS